MVRRLRRFMGTVVVGTVAIFSGASVGMASDCNAYQRSGLPDDSLRHTCITFTKVESVWFNDSLVVSGQNDAGNTPLIVNPSNSADSSKLETCQKLALIAATNPQKYVFKYHQSRTTVLVGDPTARAETYQACEVIVRG